MNKDLVATAPKDLKGMIALPSTRQEFEGILGPKSRAFASSILELYNSEATLRECDPGSILASAKMAAVLDLPIVKSLGQSCIVAYSGKAQFQIMARGFIQLALRSGQYKTAHDAIVYEGEIVSRNRLTGEVEFNPDGKKSDKIVGFLFYFRLLNGFEKYTYMTVDECKAHGKKYSRSYDNPKGKWASDFNHMALKTVVKQGLSKWGPLSTEMQRAIEVDQAEIDSEGKPNYIDAKIVDVPAEPEKPIAGPTEAKAIDATVVEDPVTFKVVKGSVKQQKTSPVQYTWKTADGKSYFTLKESVAKSAKEAGDSGADVRALITVKGNAEWCDAIDIIETSASTF